MTLSKEVAKAMSQYLERIAAELGDTDPDEKDAVLRDVESHIYAALEKAGDSPTLEDLELILSGMDSPSSYATAAAPDRDGALTFSKYAVLAGLFAPFGIGWLISWLVLFDGHMPPRGTLPVWVQILFAVGLLSPVGTTVLGLIAISAIRASKGLLIGMPLAVFTALLYPLLLLSFVVGYLPLYVLDMSGHDMTETCIGFVCLLLVVLIDVCLFLKVLKWANRPLATGEFA